MLRYVMLPKVFIYLFIIYTNFFRSIARMKGYTAERNMGMKMGRPIAWLMPSISAARIVAGVPQAAANTASMHAAWS